MSEETTSPPANPEENRKGNPFLLLIGFVILGIAAGVLLFGGNLLGSNNGAANAPALQGVPELGEPAINQVPGGAVEGLAVGDTAPDFALETPQGELVRLSDFRGQPVIVNFWATWCAPCRVEMPAFQEAFETHEEAGLMILALNREETAAQVTDYYGELGLTFPALLDSEALVADQYRVFNMPTTYFLDGEGTIVNLHRGPVTTSQIDEVLAQMTEG